MDVAAFCRRSRVVAVAGKGGVGKTTVTAVFATVAARCGINVLLVELEGRPGAAALLGTDELGYQERTVSPASQGRGEIRSRSLTPDEALVEYLDDHGLGRISRRMASSGALDVVATAVPGVRDILVLGKVKQLERRRDSDLILIDAPAAGHALTFLTSAAGLLDAARVGPIRSQAIDVMELLADPDRFQVLLVTLAEETPVNETSETAYALEDRVGAALGPVIVNGLYADRPEVDLDRHAIARALSGLPEGQAAVLREGATFYARRRQLQSEQRARLRSALPLAQLALPFQWGPVTGPGAVERLADHLESEIAALADWPASDVRPHGSAPGST